MEDPPRKYFRLSPGNEVRLYGAYYITCDEVIKDEEGQVVELRCHIDPESRGGSTPDGRRVKGTLHWVSAAHAVDAEVRLYDSLFLDEDPASSDDFHEILNPESLLVLEGAKLEPGLADARTGHPYQFMRQGYFVVDSKDAASEHLVFNRTVSLRDTWAKIREKQKKQR
jgi:glutaminyl-tRNA synthetase